MGQKWTIVQNLDAPLPIDNLCVGSGPCFNQHPPSATNRHPVLVSVLGKQVALSDMTFHIVGTHLTVPWQIPGIPLMVECLNPIVQLIGSDAMLDASRLTFQGAPYAWDPETAGFVGPVGDVYIWSGLNPAPVTNSTLVVTESTFVFGVVWAYDVDRSRVFVGWNRFQWSSGNPMGSTLSDVRDSSVVYAHNAFNVSVPGASGLLAWPGNLGTGLTRTRLLIANNEFSGDVGIQFVPGSFHDVFCLAVNNDMSQVTTPYVMDDSTPCRIIEKNPKP